MRRVMKIVAVTSVAALALAACGSSDDTSSSGSTSSSTKSALKVGLAYDIGGRGDQSFNDAAAAGLDKAKSDLGVTAQEAEATTGESESAKEDRLRTLAQAGYNPVVAVGFAYAGAVDKVAAEFPDAKFAIVDSAKGDKTPANVTSLLFAENEGSYLVGVIAAKKSKSGNIGFIGGVQVPLIQKFEAGYVAGAKSVNPDIKIQVKYLTQPPDFSGFSDPAKGKTAAQGQLDAGADVIYAAAGGSGGGVFEACKAAGASAIGVDSDQALTADASVRDVIISSMLKKVDVAVFDFIKANQDGTVKGGDQVYDLKKGGVDYATTGGHVDDIKADVDKAKQDIIDGKITVPTTP
ncbi:BMP family lipoprotein [Angustibacter luteus]|uniref:BMP family lipoprotein n=1 Tax=Angustibacter luteus TaxID=658456 RepID=UPI003CD08BA2